MKVLILIFLSAVTIHPCIAQTENVKSIALTNLTVIDVENAASLDKMTILIKGDKISSIFPANSKTLAKGVEIMDMTGHYAIPGLIDAHVHLFMQCNRNEILEKLLYSGVTSVRDMGGDARLYMKLKQEIEDGKPAGPDIYYAANFFGPEFLVDPRTKFANQGIEPGEAPWMRVITDETDLKKAVSEAKEVGVTAIKVYSSISAELLKKIAAKAHAQGVKIWSHATIFPSKPSDAVNAKVDAISHAVGMIAETAENIPNSFNKGIREFIPQQDFRNADATSPAYIELFKAMKANGTIFEPTISASRRPQNTFSHPQPPQKEDPTAHIAQVTKQLDIDAINRWVENITREAYKNGGTNAAGTDFTTEIMLVQDEIKYLAELGLTPMDALKAGTLNNARIIGIKKTHGSIAVGKQADLVILSKDPLDKIVNIRSVTLVIKDGKSHSLTK